MDATVLEIVDKVKARSVAQTALDNFVVRDGELVDLSILDQPNVSLYCLDDEAQRAIFVETPPGVDLDDAPFYYVSQYEQAQRLIAVPIADFHRVADSLPIGDVIFIHSTGRCGSTLISQALATVAGVRSLSEPDIYTQIHTLRFADRGSDEHYQRLLASATRFYASRSPTTAIKFRAMCISVGDLLCAAFPDAKNLFLYRNAEAWARSMNLQMRPAEQRRDPLPMQDIPPHWMGIAPLLSALQRATRTHPHRQRIDGARLAVAAGAVRRAVRRRNPVSRRALRGHQGAAESCAGGDLRLLRAESRR